MLNDSHYPMGETAKLGACKPDYEKLIESARKRLQKAVALKDALFDYMGNPGRVKGPLAEMIGELVIEERSATARIDNLIKKQAEEPA